MTELIELINRFWVWSKLHEGHWLSTYSTQRSGHAHCKYKGKLVLVHRLIFCKLYKLDYRDKSFFVLHTCKYKNCWNPIHLYKGNQSDNMNDSVKDMTHNNGSKTHCMYGHEFIEENVYRSNGKRNCKTCALKGKGFE